MMEQSDRKPELKAEKKSLDLPRQSVEYGRVLFETMPQGVIYQDADGRIMSANPAALHILGTTLRRLKSLTWRQFELRCLHEDGSPFPWQEQPTTLALQSGQPIRDILMQVYNLRENIHRLLNMTAMPLFRRGQKRPTHVYTLFEDITKRKETERRQQGDAFCLALVDSHHGFWDWSRVKNEMVFSPRWWHMLGYAVDEHRDEPDLWHRMIHPEDHSRVGQLLGEALAGTADSLEVQFRLRHKLGHWVHVISRIVVVRDGEGTATRVCGTNIDITERLQLEEDLRLYQRRLEVANQTLERRVLERTKELESAIREQEAFSYSVSHDLRAPLRHINSFSSILMEEFGSDLPGEGRAYLDRIGTASSKMGVLIDDLLELSRVSRTKINPQSVNMSQLVLQILHMFQETDPQRVVQTLVASDVTVLGDRTLLSQLLENLVGNAWKYTSRKPCARIEFGVIEVAGAEAMFIRDDGVGFDMKYKDKLFVAFERLHDNEFEGTGIGLATSQRIIKRHGGSIWAEGKVGEGATFYFTLPVD